MLNPFENLEVEKNLGGNKGNHDENFQKNKSVVKYLLECRICKNKFDND